MKFEPGDLIIAQVGPAVIFPARVPTPRSMNAFRRCGGISRAFSAGQMPARALSSARVDRSVARISTSHPEPGGKLPSSSIASE